MRGGSWLYKLFREIGFAEDVVRTDYCFPSREVPARPARPITFTGYSLGDDLAFLPLGISMR